MKLMRALTCTDEVVIISIVLKKKCEVGEASDLDLFFFLNFVSKL